MNQASGVPARVMEEVRREGVAPGSGLGRQEERAQRVQEDEALPLKPGEIGYRASLQAGEVTTTRGESPLPALAGPSTTAADSASYREASPDQSRASPMARGP